VEETRVPGENHWPVASHWQTLSHNVVHLAWAGFKLTTLVVISSSCTEEPSTIRWRLLLPINRYLCINKYNIEFYPNLFLPIYASYLNSKFYASDWIAFCLYFISFISYFYIGHHWFPHGTPNSYISLKQSDLISAIKKIYVSLSSVFSTK
jgi:hypothetical protein